MNVASGYVILVAIISSGCYILLLSSHLPVCLLRLLEWNDLCSYCGLQGQCGGHSGAYAVQQGAHHTSQKQGSSNPVHQHP